MNRVIFHLLVPCAVLLLAGTLPARSSALDAWSWSGSLRSLNLASEPLPADLGPSFRFSSTTLRLGADWQIAPKWRLSGALEDQLLGTDPAGILPLPRDRTNRRFDLDRTWHHNRGWDSRLQVDRLLVAHQGDGFDLALGRQAIGFGRIAIFSPLDIIAPFPPDAIDTVYRPGVDAVRLNLHYGFDGQLGALAILGDIDRHNSYLATWVDNRAGVDLLAIAGSLRQRPMIGVGLAGSLGLLGLKAELAAYRGQRFDQPDGDLHRHPVVAALEAWYRFDTGLTLVAQYLYNGFGEDDPSRYPAVLGSAPFAEGLTTLPGRHYLLVTTNYEFHPLVSGNGLLIWNLNDDSCLLRPTLDFSLGDNLALELFWSVPLGEEPDTDGFLPVVRSEYGTQADNGGLFLKWFF